MCLCLRQVDLRFHHSAVDEQAFTNTLIKDVLRTLCLVCCSMAVGQLLECVVAVQAELDHPEQPFPSGLVDPRVPYFGILAAHTLWHAFLGSVCGLRLLRGTRGSHHPWEAWALASFVGDNVVLIFNSKAVLSRLYGVNMDDAFSSAAANAEMNVLMGFMACQVSAVMFSSIRFHYLWVLPCLSAMPLGVAWDTLGLSSGGWSTPALSFTFIAVLLCTAWQKECKRREVWCLIRDLKGQEEELERRCAITMCLLRSFCDCVLTLDCDLQLLGPNPQFAAMLMWKPAGMACQASIRKFMVHEEDFLRLEALLHGTSEKDGMAKSLAVRLRDSLGNHISAHLYVASVHKASGVEHLIGVVEASQREIVTSTIGEPEHPDCIKDASQCEAVAPRHTNGSDSDSSCSHSVDMVEEESSGPLLCVRISMSPSMRLGWPDPAFKRAFGEGESFKACLEDAEPFSKWLEAMRSRLLLGQLSLPRTLDFGPISLCGNGRAHGLWWLTVTFPQHLVDDGNGSLEGVILRGKYFVEASLTHPTERQMDLAKIRAQPRQVLPGVPGS
mmetsp:Transcript_32774/g.76215  ORF Transcript_32774/g.76215 Transcript_32774/m.76215 type:complete len:556 (-) Transcript_32774:66-1733(-)